MKKIITILIGCLLLAVPVNARNVTLPHTEDFTDSDSIDDLAWASAGYGATVTRVAESWRGGGNYCVKITPPTCTAETCDSGNGGYAAIGTFNFTATNIINIALALNVGTTYSSSAQNVGGSLINKFIDLFNGTRSGLLGLNDRNDRNAHEFGLAAYPEAGYYYYGIPPHPYNDLQGIHFGDGVGTDDYAGQWIWINYIVNYSTDRVSIAIWDRNGNYSSVYFYVDSATVSQTNEIRTIGGYYNESHPTADSNSRLLIDDLTITGSATEISPPDGFLSGGGSTTTGGAGFTLTGGSLQ